ncbi:MAG TPA: tetratricopeptide repeat protein [Pyrinomonadaceae bacterium]|jgi:predicted negative regulator of RcsB-dependent stress response|nr:tetratricopeptide repeat protein [Pyrinomonadaceae bacterium]
MARKKRTPEVTLPTNEPKERVQYQDAFQQTVNKRVEEVGKTFEGKGKTFLYAVAALAVLLFLVGIFYLWNRSSDAKAQAALGKAIETSQAVVTDSPLPAGTTIKTFKTEKERAEASVAEFQSVADKFGGSVGEKAKYFIAVNKLSLDRAAATTELEGLSKSNNEIGKLSKFALAQVKAGDGKTDEAIALYQELAAADNSVIAKDTINFELAKLLEKQGKKDEAVNIYFSIAKAASEAKDADGKPVPLSSTARDAKAKVEELAPDKAKEIVEPAPESPFGGAGGGNLPLGIQ